MKKQMIQVQTIESALEGDLSFQHHGSVNALVLCGQIDHHGPARFRVAQTHKTSPARQSLLPAVFEDDGNKIVLAREMPEGVRTKGVLDLNKVRDKKE